MRRIEFLGCPMDVATMDETVDIVAERIEKKRFTRHVVVNVAKLINMRKDPVLDESVRACEIINIDGMGVVLGARILGHNVPERVAGVDLFHRLLQMSAEKGFPVFLLGAKDEIVSAARFRVEELYPNLIVAGHHHGYFWDNEAAVVKKIRESEARLLFVAITSPKKEIFTNKWRDQLGVDFVMGVGGTFDVVAGKVRRAPLWMQNYGLEWLFRTFQEPRRMWKRYLVTNSQFAWMLIKGRLGFVTTPTTPHTENRSTKIFVTGTRGVPGIPGGVEQHCEQLYPLVVAKGLEVKLSRRTPFVVEPMSEWRGIQLIDLYAPRKIGLEAAFHTVISLLIAKKWGADIVHIHAIGPAILAPLGRLLGMRVVVTNHGPDYNRQKWGGLAKAILRLGEYIGCKYANEVIVISEPIRDIVTRRCKRPSNIIYNGVSIPELTSNVGYLNLIGIEKRKYILAVARIVPEKGLHDLVDTFKEMDATVKLVIAGGSDHNDAYFKRLKESVRINENILMPGYVIGDDLAQLFTHARLYVLPSYHEGLSISLLEALSYGLPVVASDIPANKEISLDPDCYFVAGNLKDLRETLETALEKDTSDIYRKEMRQWVGEKYNWSNIADQTIAVYKKALTS